MRIAIGLRLEGDEDWPKAADYVVETERLGVDVVWSHESYVVHDPYLDALAPVVARLAGQ